MIRMCHLREAAAPWGRVVIVALLILGAYVAGSTQSGGRCLVPLPIEFGGPR